MISANVANVIQGDFLIAINVERRSDVADRADKRIWRCRRGRRGGPGAGGIVLANQNGAVLTLSGSQMGLIVAADLNGLVITLR